MLTVQERPDHVRLVVDCRYSLDESLLVFGEAFTLASRAVRNAVLLDARAITGPVPTLAERYEWGVCIADLQARQSPRIRFALLGHEPYIHPQRFGEIVATSRGAVARGFTDEADAMNWLLAKSRSP